MTIRSMLHPLAPVLLMFMLMTSASVARGAEEEAESPMQPGAWAIQFGIGDNFDLESFSGGALSVKRHSSANCAWRAGVNLSASSLGRDTSVEFADSTTLEEEDFDTEFAGVDLDWLRYFGAGTTVRPYFGFGPRVSWSHGGSSNSARERDQHSWSVGVGGLLGAEYRAASAIGIHAEYRYALSYTSRTEELRAELDVPPVLRYEDTSWQLSGGGVRFGLSAYF